MATTSLWHSKGQLGDLIAYVENPEKTGQRHRGLFQCIFVHPEPAENRRRLVCHLY